MEHAEIKTSFKQHITMAQSTGFLRKIIYFDAKCDFKIWVGRFRKAYDKEEEKAAEIFPFNISHEIFQEISNLGLARYYE